MTADTAFIATLADGSGYVLLVDDKVVTGPFDTIIEAVKAKNELKAETEARSA